MYVSEICAEGIFVTFPWWLENVKSRSKIALLSNKRHFEIWFRKKRTIPFFWSKLSKLHKKDPIFACGNYIFPKTKGNKNKPWTHSTPLSPTILEFDNRRIEAPRPKLLSSNNCILWDNTGYQLGTVPNSILKGGDRKGNFIMVIIDEIFKIVITNDWTLGHGYTNYFFPCMYV